MISYDELEVLSSVQARLANIEERITEIEKWTQRLDPLIRLAEKLAKVKV